MSSWQSHFTWKVTGPCTFHSALCKLHYYAWQLDVNSSGGDEIEGLKAVSWQWGGDFWYQILEFGGLQAMFPLATVRCGFSVPNTCCAQLGVWIRLKVQKLMEEKRKLTEENRKPIEDNQCWKQGFPVGGLKVRSLGGTMRCWEQSLYVLFCLWSILMSDDHWDTHSKPHHITHHGFQTQVGGEGGRGGKTLDRGNPLFCVNGMLAAASTWVEVSTKAAMHVLTCSKLSGRAEGAEDAGTCSGPCGTSCWVEMGPREFHPGFWDKFPLQWWRWHLSVQALRYVCRGGSVVVFFGSKAACPLQIGQRIWPQSLRHPTFPLWMPANSFPCAKGWRG